MSKVIGIDLGTTNSVVCVMEHGDPRVIINEEGGRITPSVVGFSRDGERFVGDIAKRQMLMSPESTIHSIKRLMGLSFEDAEEDIRRLAYKIIPDGESLAIEVDGKVHTPQQISAFILQKVKKSAEDFLGETVDEAVITVPAYFTDRQRQATRDAGEIAGLNVLRIINEPTAAALAYTFRRKESATIAVYDFGGGTLDVSILDVSEDVAEVCATAGDNHLGGNDVDARVVDWLAREFEKETGVDISSDLPVLQRLAEAAEKAKIDLSSSMETEIQLPFLTAGEEGPLHLQTTLSRAAFEFLVEEILDRTLQQCRKALEESGKSAAEIDEVILVGGSSRIPKVQEMIAELFGDKLNKSFNPDEVVAVGAALQAGILSGTLTDMTLLDVTNFSLGIETQGRRFARLIPKGSTVPVVRTQMVSTVVDNQNTVKIHVLQGEEPMAGDNISLGQFELTGIEDQERGVPRIDVTFTIDTDGIVNVTGRDTRTGAEQSIRIHSPSAMSQQQIDSAKSDLEEFSVAETMTKEIEELRHKVEKFLFALENLLRANKVLFKKREIFDTEQALKRGRMALVKRADAASLTELIEYLDSYQALVRNRIADARAGSDKLAAGDDA
jgi:molecular chaperone DnaK